MNISLLLHKLAILVGLVPVCMTDGSNFELGKYRYCYTQMPQGVQRINWYEKMLQAEESGYKKIVEQGLAMTDVDIVHCREKALVAIAEQEQTLQTTQENMIGSWVKDDRLRTYRKVSMDYVAQNADEYVFTIEQRDLDELISLARQAGHTGPVIFMNHDGHGGMIAYHSVLAVQIDIILKHKFDESSAAVFIQFLHEMSHITHQDLLWSETIKERVKSLTVVDASGNQTLNTQLLQQQGASLDDYDKALSAFKKWWAFHERRADMEAYLSARQYSHIVPIKTIGGAGHVIADTNIRFAYEQSSPVAYCTDFSHGVIHDQSL